MINLSLQTGSFPDTWKHADVRPRLKKPNSEATFSNLRPISNLPFASKLTERAVFLQMHDHLSTHNLYPLAESSYRQHHCTATALLRVKNDILLNMNQQRVTLLVLLDLCTVFDTVDLTILLDHLHRDFGTSGQVHSWFESYLRDRISTTFQMKYGVPQGSRLGLLLFVIYASKLFEINERHLPAAHTYADDTQLYISFNADSSAEQSTAVEAMQNCIADIREWMLRDRLRLNDGKTEFIIIGTRQQLAKVTIAIFQVGESVTSPASEVNDFGCWFDRHLKMDTHINNICKAPFFHLFNITRIRKFPSRMYKNFSERFRDQSLGLL